MSTTPQGTYWRKGWRDTAWDRLREPWDVIVVGGGITGAGILAEAARRGLRAVLVEAGDFGAGTSSRSSKLVHGGLRYLKQAQVGLTIESVRERDALLREGSGLISPLTFLLTSFKGDKTPPWVFGFGLFLYDVIACRWAHKKLRAEEVLAREPVLEGTPLVGAYSYQDAQTDDARLVLRVLGEAVAHGAVALNYVRAEEPLRMESGRVVGVAVRDVADGQRTAEVKAPVVINASGAWADTLRVRLGAPRRLRLIRGSHLVFSGSRLPVAEAISLVHPSDNRAVFALPWEGITLIGTTDVDHGDSLVDEPAISEGEAQYLLELVQHAFPSLGLSMADVRATYAGVRPVIDTGASSPTKESREHALWNEEGMLTITGGKLTTFHLMARQALRAVRKQIKAPKRAPKGPLLQPVGDLADALSSLDAPTAARLLARYGRLAPEVAAAGGSLESIGDSDARWTELAWAARNEAVVHLDDLLLRRVRLGLLLLRGGIDELPRIRTAVQAELDWDDAKWLEEERAYRETWQRCYGPPT